MKYPGKRLLIAVVLTTAALCASSTDAQRPAETAEKDRAVFIRMPNEWKPRGFEARVRDGKAVSVVVVKHDGSKVPLKQISAPTRPTSCPAGQTLSCWEDEAQLMSTCVCTSVGTTAGEYGVASVFNASAR
jgi:hypothetical protein